jgi:HPt (histidine-containing phosphotransfer) domain-containing protein
MNEAGSGQVSDGVLEREQIELLLSLDDGAGDVLVEIVGEFLVQSDDLRTQLLSAAGAGDLGVVQRTAHTLKGASANVGAVRLAAACAQFESAVPAPQPHETAAFVGRFETEYWRALEALGALTRER